MRKGPSPRVIYHQVYLHTKIKSKVKCVPHTIASLSAHPKPETRKQVELHDKTVLTGVKTVLKPCANVSNTRVAST